MVGEEQYCVNILTQIAAARSAIDQIGVELATAHVKTCILGQGTEAQHGTAKEMSQGELLDELRVTLGRLVR